MATVPTGRMERELRKLYLQWLAGVPSHQNDLNAYINTFQLKSTALIAREGGRVAALGALADFPVPKLLELSPVAGVAYDQMKQAAIQAGIATGLNAKDIARQIQAAGLDKGYRRLERLARTETVSAYWKNAWDSTADLPLIVMVWGSEMSKKTCDYCQSRDGLVIEDPNIRDHPNGRCTPIPTLRSQVKYRGTLQPDGSVDMDPRWADQKVKGAKAKASAGPTTPEQRDPLSGKANPAAPSKAQPVHQSPISNQDKIKNAETMFGTGSKQHQEAVRRFGSKVEAPVVKPSAIPNGDIAAGMAKAERQRKDLERAMWHRKQLNAERGWDFETRKAWTSYTEMGHKDMNALLRDPKAYAASADYDEYFAELFSKQIDLLKNLFTKNTLTDDVVVARGVTVAKGFNPADLQPGAMFADPAFISTTTNLKEAADFAAGRGYRASEGGGWTFITRAPKGTNAVPGADYQNEIVFKPGQMQRVLSVDPEQRIVYTEMIP